MCHNRLLDTIAVVRERVHNGGICELIFIDVPELLSPQNIFGKRVLSVMRVLPVFRCLLCVFLFSFSLMFWEGCSPPEVCTPGKLSSLTLSPAGSVCTQDCECNNQSYIGYCQNKICKSVQRAACSAPNEVGNCVGFKTGCDGRRVCKPQEITVGLFWGDCVCNPPKIEPKIIAVRLSSEKMTVYLNQKVQLKATVEVQGEIDNGLIWSSSDDKVVTVDEKGWLTGLLPEKSAQITAKSRANPTKKASITIEVKVPPLPKTSLSGLFQVKTKSNRIFHWHEKNNQIIIHQARGNQSIFEFLPQKDGSYRIKCRGSQRYLHSDNKKEGQLSTQTQTDDDHGRFLLEQQSDGAYRVKVKGSSRYLQGDINASGPLSTRSAETYKTVFYLEPILSGTYQIRVKGSKRYLHSNETSDQLLSTRSQPNNEHTRFEMLRQPKTSLSPGGSYQIKVGGTGRLLHENGNDDKMVSTRYQANDDFTRFFLMPQLDGSYRIWVKATSSRSRRYWRETNQLISTLNQTKDDFSYFFLIPWKK